MVLFKKILRIVRNLVLILLAFVIGALAVLTLTQKGRENLAGLISDFASSADRKIMVTGISGIWSGYLRVDHLVVEDASGPWLGAHNVEIDWSPLALLSATFKAERIFAGDVELARLPKAPAARTSEQGASLPVALDLDKIDLPDIKLGPDLAGRGVARLKANGSAVAEASPLNIESDFTIARTDGVAGDIDASIHFVPTQNKLEVDIRASEPSGGILANLLGLSGTPAVDVLISGSGSLDNWRGTGAFAVDGKLVTKLDGVYRLTDGGRLVEAKGDGEFAPFLPANLRPLLAGQAKFDVAATLTEAGGVSVERASLQSDGLRGTAAGTINPEGASDFSLALEATAESGIPLSFGTDESPIDLTVRSASVRAFGDGRKPVLDITASLPAISTNTTRLGDIALTLHSDEFDINQRIGPVAGSVTAATLTIDNPTISPLVSGEVHAELSGLLEADALTVQTGALRSDAIDGAFGGRVSLTDGAIALDLKAEVLSAALPASVRAALDERLAVTTSLVRDAEGNVSAKSLQLASGGLTGGGTISLTGDQIDADIAGALTDFSKVAPQTTGAVQFSVTAKGTRTAPDFSVAITSEQVVAAGRQINDFKLAASGKADIANPAASLSLTGTVADQPLAGKADLVSVDDNRQIKGISLSLGNNSISGDLAFGADFLPLGTLAFDLPDIASLAGLADEAAQGAMSGTIELGKQGGLPQARIVANAPSVTRGDIAAGSVAIDALIANYIDAPMISGSLKAGSLVAGATSVRDIDVALTGDDGWTGFAGGATVNDIPAKAAGRARLAAGTVTVELASAEATVRGIKAAVSQLSTIVIANGQTRLDGLTLDLGGGSAVVSGTAGSALDLDVKLADLPAAIADGFVQGLDAAGAVTGAVKVGGAASAPSITYDLGWLGAATAQTRKAGIAAVDLRSAGSFAAGTLTVDSASLDSPEITGSAQGTLNPQGATDFFLQLKAKQAGGLPLVFGTAQSPVRLSLGSISVVAKGDGSKPALDISGSFPSLSTSVARLDGVALALHSDAFDIAQRSGPVSARLTAGNIALENQTVAPLLAGEIRTELVGALSPDLLTISNAKLHGDAIDGDFSGTVSLADGSVALDLTADLLSAALPAAIRPALADRLGASAVLKRDAGGAISVGSLALSSGGFSAGGILKLSSDMVDAEISGALSDIAPLAPQTSGAVTFSATAKGPLAAADLSATIASDRIVTAGREITGLRFKATGKADPANPAADVSLTGTVAGEALSGSAVLKTIDGRREINGLTLSLGQNKISGDLVLDDAFVPLGKLAFDLPDIGPLAALALDSAEGDLRGTIDFTSQGAVPQIKVSAATASLTRGDVSAKAVAVDALIADYFAAPAISGTVRAQSVVSGTTRVRDIDIKLSRDGVWTGFSGGAVVGDIPAKAAGRVKFAGGVTTLELASGEATVRGINAALARPSTVVVAGGQAKLDRLTLNLGGGSAVISGTAGSALALDVTLNKLPASLADAFAPGLAAGGTISGTVKATGSAAAPAIAYTLDWTGAATAQTRAAGLRALSLRSKGNFAANRLTFDASASDGAGLSFKGGGSVATSGTPQLSLDFSGDVPFSFLTQRLAAQGLSLGGSASVNVKVTGPATAPSITGSVRTSGARLVDARSGLAINDISAEIALGGDRATISRASGRLSSGGNLSASGTIGIAAGSGFPADIAIKLTEARYTDGRVVTATLNGDLAIKGPLVSTPVISGTINLGKTVITVPERLPSSLETLDIKRRNAPAAVRAQDRALRPAAASGSGGGGLVLDVTINAPQQIFIQGRGLDAELGGTLRLQGPASAPQATGEFTMRRGRLVILGKRLTFTRGTLGFAGSLVPYLDLAAESKANDATVTVLVTGPANNPKFGFSSIPSLPEDEVLARLIFGRSMSNLSPLQIAQLAEAAAQFAGIGGSTSLLENLRNKLGVDDLDIKTDDKGGTAVSAGKYLNDRTYVTIEKGDKPGSGKAAIDLDVGRGVKLRGEATDEGEAKGGIFFEREY